MTDSWVDLVDKKAQIIIDQIVAARVLLSRNEAQVEGFDRPYLDLLRQLYQEEFPLAQLIDSSDLVARFEGRRNYGRKRSDESCYFCRIGTENSNSSHRQGDSRPQ